MEVLRDERRESYTRINAWAESLFEKKSAKRVSSGGQAELRLIEVNSSKRAREHKRKGQRVTT